MIREKFRLYSIINLVGDLILLLSSFLLGYLMIWGDFKSNFRDFFLQATFAMVICWLIVAYYLELYTPKRFEQFEKSFSKHFQAIVFHAMLLSTVILLLTNYGWPGILFLYGYFFFLIFDTLLRIGLMFQLRKERLSGKNTFRVIVVGGDGMGKRMFDTLNEYTGYGFKPLGIFDDKTSNGAGYSLNGNIEDAKRFAVENKIDEIFCALPLRETEKINQLLRFAEDNLIRFKVVPDFSAFHNRNITVDFYGFYPVISLQPEPLSNVFNQMIKRSFDIVFSSLVIVFILSWLIPLVALLIRFDSKGSVFYFQNRSGKDYQIFKIFKFRTMTVTEADTEYVQAQKNDSRITRVGKYLRKLNVDELPQFLNVWLGDMSVVGPRPHPIKLNEIYRPIVEKYMTRHLAKPGLTGLAQIRGFRGETADPEMMHGRVVADVFYIENWSFLLDIKIILLTIWNMVKGEKNAY
ncbi:MAG: undecaprenyl-phosphate glucose phosphotransferase [Chitinophagales bacterium]